MDLCHFAYLINNFDIKKLETYKKTMVYDQIEK